MKRSKKVPKRIPKVPKDDGSVPVNKMVEECVLEYGTYVNEQRHIPDYRDGLKPVQRRVLWTTFENGVRWDSRFTKCAEIVGNTIARYHPHGDKACYDALVMMTGTPTKDDKNILFGPNWSNPLIEGYGNFGNIDGDKAAEMRYPECRLSSLSQFLFSLKSCTSFVPNYLNTRDEPLFLPSTIPILLFNGVGGIALGVTTNFLPHNIGEVCDALILCLRKSKVPSVKLLMKYLKGPDWTYGGLIWDLDEVRTVFETGKGSINWGFNTEVQEVGKRWIVKILGIPPRFNLKAYLLKLNDEKEVKKIRNVESSDRVEIHIEVSTKQMMEKIVTHKYSTKNFWNVTIRKSESEVDFRSVNLRTYLEMWIEYCIDLHKKYFRFEIDRLTREIVDDELRIRVYANGEKVIRLMKIEAYRAIQKLVAPCTEDQFNRIVKSITLGSFARTSTSGIRKRIKSKSEELKLFKGRLRNTEKYLIAFFKEVKKYSRKRQTFLLND